MLRLLPLAFTLAVKWRVGAASGRRGDASTVDSAIRRIERRALEGNI
jgi:hypothetical protein